MKSLAQGNVSSHGARLVHPEITDLNVKILFFFSLSYLDLILLYTIEENHFDCDEVLLSFSYWVNSENKVLYCEALVKIKQ